MEKTSQQGMLFLLRAGYAALVALTLPLVHLNFGEEYPGGGPHATGFMLIFMMLGAVAGVVYFLIGTAAQLLLGNERARTAKILDLVLLVACVAVLAYGGVTARYN